MTTKPKKRMKIRKRKLVKISNLKTGDIVEFATGEIGITKAFGPKIWGHRDIIFHLEDGSSCSTTIHFKDDDITVLLLGRGKLKIEFEETYKP